MQKCNNTDIYAARIKDEQILAMSSSGGLFTAIADYFLDNKEAVACCYYNSGTNRAEYKLMFSKEDIAVGRGSKYMYSFLGEIYKESVQWLINNPQKHLLFVGTGCQAAGFCRFAEEKKLRDRVVAVDLICHGLPSPNIWDLYTGFLKKKYRGTIESISFRDKRKGWANPTAVATINGKEVSLDGYTRIYYDARAMRPSCYKCPYTSFIRYTDMTIGDFWGIEKNLPEFYKPTGNSLILIHTEHGRKVFSEIKEKLDYVQSNTKDSWQYNLEFPTKEPLDRQEFWNDYYRKKHSCFLEKYAHPLLIRKVYNRIIKYLKNQLRNN